MKVIDYKAMIKHSIHNNTKDWGHYITLAQEDEDINFLDFRNIIEFAYLYSNKNRSNKYENEITKLSLYKEQPKITNNELSQIKNEIIELYGTDCPDWCICVSSQVGCPYCQAINDVLDIIKRKELDYDRNTN